MPIDSDVSVRHSVRHEDAYIVDGQVIPATLLQVLAAAVRRRGTARVLHALQDIRDVRDIENRTGTIAIRD
jgi:hypothetical protein